MAARSTRAFLEHFVLPLVAGGELCVASPIDANDLERFERELPEVSDAQERVDEARTAVVAEVVVRPPPLILEGDELHLAAALHNLLFLAHPAVERWSVTRAARAKIVAAAERFAARPRSEARRRVLGRHALLHNLFSLTRTDIELTWWTGRASYRGQTPPARLTAWGDVRRVSEERTTARFDDLLGGLEVAPVVATLIRRSPLSQLLAPEQSSIPLYWEDAAFLLRDAELARAIAYRALSADRAGEHWIAPARLALAFERMLERAPADKDVRAVAAFLVHLHALLALDGGAVDNSVGRRAGLDLASGRGPRGLHTFFALPSILAELEPALATPPGIRGDSLSERRWARHLEGIAAVAGPTDELARHLRRHLGSVLLSAPADATPSGHG